jgi:multiple sugar transport system permease protein
LTVSVEPDSTRASRIFVTAPKGLKIDKSSSITFVARDLENAAMVDGCTRVGALFKVVVPLSAPGVFTAGILAFVNSWDEFLLALSFNSNPSLRTLPVGITLYQGEFAFPWPVISAALVVGIVPLAALIVVFQERVVSGLTSGGLKG